MSPWLSRSYTAHMALGSVLLYRMTSMREVHHGHDGYPHTTCVSTSQPQDTLNTGMFLDLGKSTVNDISLCKNYGYVCVWGRPREQGRWGGSKTLQKWNLHIHSFLIYLGWCPFVRTYVMHTRFCEKLDLDPWALDPSPLIFS